MRFRSGKFGILGVAAGAALMLTGTTGLAANAGGAAVVGSGTIAPGLSTVPTTQTVTFGGTAAGAGVIGTTPVVVNDTCTFSGSSVIAETVAQGEGNATGSCTGTAAISASVHYTRAGGAVAIQGSGTVNGTAATITAACSFEPTSAPTVVSYQLQCAVAIT
jgi:hypothetical protein